MICDFALWSITSKSSAISSRKKCSYNHTSLAKTSKWKREPVLSALLLIHHLAMQQVRNATLKLVTNYFILKLLSTKGFKNCFLKRNKKQSRLGKQYGKLNCLLVFVLCLSPYTQHPPPHTSSCASTALCSLLVGQGGWCSAPETAVWRWHLSLRAAACYKYRQRLPAVLPSDNYSWEWVGKQLIWALRDGRRRENLVLKERLGWVADWCILCHNQSTHLFIQMQGTPKVFLYTHFVSAKTKKKKRKPTRYSEQYWRYRPLVMLIAMLIPR